MVLGAVRDLRSPRSLGGPDEAAAYQEHLLAEYVLARLAHAVADGTVRGEVTAGEGFLDWAGPTAIQYCAERCLAEQAASPARQPELC